MIGVVFATLGLRGERGFRLPRKESMHSVKTQIWDDHECTVLLEC